MRLFLLGIALIILSLAVFAPHPARADVLPDCDQTVYLYDNDTVTPKIPCNPEERESTCIELSTAQYNKKFPTVQDKKDHPPVAITNNRNCGFNDFVQLFINLAQWGLGILAGLALLVMVWGGFTMLTSLGNQEKIREGKLTVWGSLLGISIVLTSWILIGFFVSALTGTGFTLFANTPFSRVFYGRSPCPSNYRACSYDQLQTMCKDDPKNDNAVTRTQSILANLGCYKNPVDGCFGPKTSEAVIKFQRANANCEAEPEESGLRVTMPAANGVVDIVTYVFLDAAQNNKQITCTDSAGRPVQMQVRRCQ